MELEFHGAAGDVTGSAHLVRYGRSRVLLDCGLYQGRREESYRRNARCRFDPRKLDAVVLSHAHIDHSGKLPMLVRLGFRGAIHATPASRDLCAPMLADCARILFSDAEHLNRQRARRRLAASRSGARSRRRRARAASSPAPDAGDLLDEAGDETPSPRGGAAGQGPGACDDLLARLDAADLPAREVLPLYLEEDVDDALALYVEHEYGSWFEAAPGMRFRFHDAGHILGSAWVEGEFGDGAARERLVYTGDYGRHHQPILRDPEPLLAADVVVSESTYGDREHPPYESTDAELAAAVRRLAQRGRGRLLIPAFAVGRTQNVLYGLAQIYRRGEAPPVDVVVDSPLATAATAVVARHPECFDRQALAEWRRMNEEGGFRSRLRFTESVDESKALNDDPRPLIVVSASGMMETGRILHHLAHHVSSPDTEVVVVGFQAQHTLGRRLVDGAPRIKVYGVEYAVRARVTVLPGFSAHADRSELLDALAPVAPGARALFLVHGEDDQRRPLAAALRERGAARVELPDVGSRYALGGAKRAGAGA